MSKVDSKYLSYILRHKPEDVGITLDEYGYTDVKILCKKLNISEAELEKIVADNTRYVYNKDHTKVKAAHGHSVPVKYENTQEPPKFLYHGTSFDFIDDIMKEGLKPMSRDKVHLSESQSDAEKIGKRHTRGKILPAVLEIYAGAMFENGFEFNKSEDGVWLTDSVPPDYIFLLID